MGVLAANVASVLDRHFDLRKEPGELGGCASAKEEDFGAAIVRDNGEAHLEHGRMVISSACI